MKKEQISLERSPVIKGLKFRKYLGNQDFPEMMKVINAAAIADKDKSGETLADLKHDYQHLTNCDPYQDMIMAEIDDELIAYARVTWWQEEEPNDRIYSHFVNITPEWRDQGIELAIIQWCEARLRDIAGDHPQDSQRIFQTYSNEFKTSFNHLLESQDYEPARFFIEMSRPLDEIPTADMPPGIVVRPVLKEDHRKIWEASIDAFRDHWGYSEPKEEDYKNYTGSKYFQPDLWQVAWDGDEVVASVLNYIDPDYNSKHNCKRGWTEDISTRKAWRRRGIAKALIARSMHLHKEKGMKEVGLGVDTFNPSGALKLYEDLGYKKEKTFVNYRKPM